MIAALATPFFTPLAIVLTEDGDEHSDFPVSAWRDEDNRILLDESNNTVLS
jgi:hypothetical protein